jgi:A/G-specific adenine glycosylase
VTQRTDGRTIVEQSFSTSEAHRLRRFFSAWYRENGRWFPWRASEVSPFHILIAEMMLRQTNARTVGNVWNTFREQFPEPATCLNSEPAALNAILRPLGLVNQRSNAIHQVCQALVDHHIGQVPHKVKVLQELPHIGPYSANAVACFAFNRRLAIVDGNVLRVLSRLTGRSYGLDNRRSQQAWADAESILPRRAKPHNYGILDFAASICTARHPRHELCPLRDMCRFYLERMAKLKT